MEAGEHAKASEHPPAGGSGGEDPRERAWSVLVEVGRQMAEPCTLTCTGVHGKRRLGDLSSKLCGLGSNVIFFHASFI